MPNGLKKVLLWRRALYPNCFPHLVVVKASAMNKTQASLLLKQFDEKMLDLIQWRAGIDSEFAILPELSCVAPPPELERGTQLPKQPVLTLVPPLPSLPEASSLPAQPTDRRA
jgi:hypothetical protein